VERFVEVLEHGKSLFGLGAACDEWRVEPGESEVDISTDDDASGQNDPHERDGIEHRAWNGEGRVTARKPDAQGRIYGFSYRLKRDRRFVQMSIVGRGSWSPAPGVMIRDADNKDMFVIGSARYCIVEVDVHGSPDDREAILVGDETWFLSRDACVRSRKAAVGMPRGCSDMKPHRGDAVVPR
jgi:hypothetical protein